MRFVDRIFVFVTLLNFFFRFLDFYFVRHLFSLLLSYCLISILLNKIKALMEESYHIVREMLHFFGKLTLSDSSFKQAIRNI